MFELSLKLLKIFGLIVASEEIEKFVFIFIHKLGHLIDKPIYY